MQDVGEWMSEERGPTTTTVHTTDKCCAIAMLGNERQSGRRKGEQRGTKLRLSSQPHPR